MYSFIFPRVLDYCWRRSDESHQWDKHRRNARSRRIDSYQLRPFYPQRKWRYSAYAITITATDTTCSVGFRLAGIVHSILPAREPQPIPRFFMLAHSRIFMQFKMIENNDVGIRDCRPIFAVRQCFRLIGTSTSSGAAQTVGNDILRQQ